MLKAHTNAILISALVGGKLLASRPVEFVPKKRTQVLFEREVGLATILTELSFMNTVA
jgi:Tfp pilus assembly ATPase PilU